MTQLSLDTAPERGIVKVSPAEPLGRPRLDSIDLLRGVVIVLMALDHVKGNIARLPFEPLDLTHTTPAYFLTRWVTHFCAPVFVFLAGTGAFLYGARGRSKRELAWFLLSRGVWLIFLELTVIRFSWFLNVNYLFSFGQVIWAIGWAMILLAGLVFLPISAVTVFGLALILFHNLFDGVHAADWGKYRWLWCILHTGEMLEPFPNRKFLPFYPLIPWVGVLAAGYGLGPLMLLDAKRRRKELLGLGLALILVFVALRYGNLYGDKVSARAGQPGPWSVQKDWLFTAFSFVNCQKYPPSLAFLLMTLGPALVFLGLVDGGPGRLGRFFVVFGRVPLFFYLLHWFVIKDVAIGLAYARYQRADWMYGTPAEGAAPPDYGYSLWVVYGVWLGVVLFLFPLCYWFAGVKRRSRAAWLSYL
ncbi:MAG: DUF1624 domain-containing protein [Planctomycetota bacterium]|nr:MAG: DUF1624 domain-containing protein [Planctomycetota bacterium]